MATRKDFIQYKAMVLAKDPMALDFGIRKGISTAKLRNPFSARWDFE
jgi:hypothetical protein